jgi:hypothetical protein
MLQPIIMSNAIMAQDSRFFKKEMHEIMRGGTMKSHYCVLFFAIMISVSTWADTDTVSYNRWRKAMSENDSYLRLLQVLDNNVRENAAALILTMQKKRTTFMETAPYHSAEIGRSLAASQEYLDRLSRVSDIALDEIGIAYFAGLHRHYRKAIEEQKAIQAELIKQSPVTDFIIMKAQIIYSEMAEAGAEQIEIKRKLDIKEPVFPRIK